MKLRGGEFSTGTTGNFQPELTAGLMSLAWAGISNWGGYSYNLREWAELGQRKRFALTDALTWDWTRYLPGLLLWCVGLGLVLGIRRQSRAG